jgi:hypothetical protein
MKKTWRMLTFSPRSAEQLRYRTTLRLGAMGLAALAIFLLIRFWYLAVTAALIAFVLRLLIKRIR